MIHLTNCKVSTFIVPDVWYSDVKFKVTLKGTGVLPSKKWVDIWNVDIYGLYKGSLKIQRPI